MRTKKFMLFEYFSIKTTDGEQWRRPEFISNFWPGGLAPRHSAQRHLAEQWKTRCSAYATLSVTKWSIFYCYAECCADCRIDEWFLSVMLRVVMINVLMLSVLMQTVLMLSVLMPCVHMLSVIVWVIMLNALWLSVLMLCVVMLNVLLRTVVMLSVMFLLLRRVSLH